jgi:hypothetical protein
MSFVFRGARSDIENGFPSFVPERRTLVILLLMSLLSLFLFLVDYVIICCVFF